MIDFQTLIDDPRIPKKTITTTELLTTYSIYHTARPITGELVVFIVHNYETDCNGHGGNVYQLEKLIPFNDEHKTETDRRD
jgi:hypothetical protein